jgi:hypothetical protein
LNSKDEDVTSLLTSKFAGLTISNPNKQESLVATVNISINDMKEMISILGIANDTSLSSLNNFLSE